MNRIHIFLISLLSVLSLCFVPGGTASTREQNLTHNGTHTHVTILNAQHNSPTGRGLYFSGPISVVCAGIHALYSWWKSDSSESMPASISTYEQPTIKQPFIIPERLTRHEARNVPSMSYRQQYRIDSAAQLFLRHNGLHVQEYQSYTGTAMQHALHQECIALVHDTAHLNTSLHPTFLQYQTILARVIDAGRACAHANLIDRACTMLDWAHTCMRYARAVSQGIIEGVQHTLHTLTHPRKCIAQLSRDAHEFVHITLRMLYESGLIETLIDIDNDALLDAYISDRSAYLTALVARIEHYATKLMEPNGVRAAVASVTHMALTGKCLHAVAKFFSFAAHNASLAVTRIGDVAAHEAQSITAIADGILVNAAQESAQFALHAAEQQLPKAKALSTIAACEPPAVHIERIAQKYPLWATDECKPLVHILKGEISPPRQAEGIAP